MLRLKFALGVQSSSVLALAAAGLLAACASGNGATPEDDVASTVMTNDALTDYPAFKNWAMSRFAREIPVCVNTALRSDSNELVNYWKHTISRSWTQATGIAFTGWQPCTAPNGPTLGQPNAINLQVDASGCDAGNTQLLGTESDGTSYVLIMICASKLYDDGVVIHEFGHALGFTHEADRIDFPKITSSNCPLMGIANGTSSDYNEATLPDPFSMMNATYCHFGIELSYQDTKGAQVAWGRPNYFADVTGDGADDAIVVNPDGIYVIANAGKVTASGGHFSGAPVSWGGESDAAEYYFADMSGDGRADLIVGDKYGFLKVYISDGTKFTRSIHEKSTGTFWRSIRGLSFADIDGDGRADAISFVPNDFTTPDRNKTFLVAFSNGGTFNFKQAVLLRNFPNPNGGVGTHGWFADVTGPDSDGKSRADYVYYNTGGVWVSKNFPTGSQSAVSGFQEPTLWIAQSGDWLGDNKRPGMPLLFADISGDGKQDYVTTIPSVSPGYPARESINAIYSTGNAFGSSGFTVAPGYDLEKGIYAAKLSKTSNARSLVFVNRNSIYAYDSASYSVWDLTGRPYYAGSIPRTMYTMGVAYSNDVLWTANNANDGSAATSYSSNYFPSSANTRDTLLAAWFGDGSVRNINTLVLTARVFNGKPQGFPKSYDVYVAADSTNTWKLVGHFTTQPTLPSWTAVVPLGATYPAFGIYVLPTELGVDAYNSNYFQMAEMRTGLAG